MQDLLIWFSIITVGLLVLAIIVLLKHAQHYQRHHQEGDHGLSVRLEKALGYFRERGDLTAKEYQVYVNVSHSTAMRDLEELEQLGLIKQVGSHGPGVYYHVLTK